MSVLHQSCFIADAIETTTAEYYYLCKTLKACVLMFGLPPCLGVGVGGGAGDGPGGNGCG